MTLSLENQEKDLLSVKLLSKLSQTRSRDPFPVHFHSFHLLACQEIDFVSKFKTSLFSPAQFSAFCTQQLDYRVFSFLSCSSKSIAMSSGIPPFTNLLTPESVLIFFLYTVKFLMSHTFTVWSSLAERISSPFVNTAALTALQTDKHTEKHKQKTEV